MDSNITFGIWGGTCLIINSVCSRVFLNFPRQIIEVAGSAAWMIVIYIFTIMLILFSLIQKLFSKFEGKDIIDISEEAMGNVGRVIVGTLVILLLFSIGCIILREYSENMKTIALADSPIGFVSWFFLAGMAFGAFLGIEPLVRFHSLAVPLIVSTFLFIVLAVMPYYDSSNFAPWLGNGPTKILGPGFFSTSIFSPILYLFLIPPFIKTNKNFKIIGYLGISICTFLLFVSVVTYTAVYHYPTSLESFLPTFQLARLINFGRFFERIESVFMLAWAASALIYLSIIMFFILYTFKKTFKLQYYKPLIFISTILLFNLSLLPPNLISAIDLEVKYYSKLSLIITLLLPLLVAFIGNIRQRKKVNNNNEKNH